LSELLALDTSVAVPLLVQTHTAHISVVSWWAGRPVALCGHAAVETYAVLTRLPGDLRLTPADAARLLDERFQQPLTLRVETARRFARVLGDLQIAGGATYDALVALAAVDHDVPLATRDARAKDTYDRVGVETIIAA